MKRTITEMREEVSRAKKDEVKSVQRLCTRGTIWPQPRVLEKAVARDWQILECNDDGRTRDEAVEYGESNEFPTRKTLDRLWADAHPDTTELVIEGHVYTIDETIRPIEDMWELAEPTGTWWQVILEGRSSISGKAMAATEDCDARR